MKFAFSDIAVSVRDAKASAKWWKQSCGFEIRSNAGHWVTVAAPGTNVEIHLCSGEGYPLDEGNTGVGWLVDDIFSVYETWRAKGVRFPKPPVQESASVNARFSDPDGNEYWLFQDDELKEKPRPKKRAARKRAARKRGTARPKKSRRR